MNESFNIIGLGEILWDLLPDGKQLGGAPANFAYIASQLGNCGIVLSRVGDDECGCAILEELKAKNIATENIQIDAKNPTGIVNVSLSCDGQPRYEIAKNAAWDFLELSGDWREIAETADAVCFGSLAQRNSVSRKTICEFVDLIKGLRIFDVNLRQQFFSPKTLGKSLNLANVVKLNHEELPIIAKMFEIKMMNPVETAQKLLVQFDLELICVTRGENGSILVSKNEFAENAGLKIEVKDTIGAGDAFTAALAHGILRGWKLTEINEYANKVGAFVASNRGAMPQFPEGF